MLQKTLAPGDDKADIYSEKCAFWKRENTFCKWCTVDHCALNISCQIPLHCEAYLHSLFYSRTWYHNLLLIAWTYPQTEHRLCYDCACPFDWLCKLQGPSLLSFLRWFRNKKCLLLVGNHTNPMYCCKQKTDCIVVFKSHFLTKWSSHFKVIMHVTREPKFQNFHANFPNSSHSGCFVCNRASASSVTVCTSLSASLHNKEFLHVLHFLSHCPFVCLSFCLF